MSNPHYQYTEHGYYIVTRWFNGQLIQEIMLVEEVQPIDLSQQARQNESPRGTLHISIIDDPYKPE